MEMLPAETIRDESKLVEITNSKVLAHVNNLVLGLVQAGNAANNAVQTEILENDELRLSKFAQLDSLEEENTLHLGAVSREQCTALLPTYTKQVSDTQEHVTAWHEDACHVDSSELYNEDVQLISKDGKLYYLPESKAE